MKLNYIIKRNYLENELKSSFLIINTKTLDEEEINLLISTFEPDVFEPEFVEEAIDQFLTYGSYPIDLKEYSEEEILLKLAILGYEPVKTGEKENFKKLYDIRPLDIF